MADVIDMPLVRDCHCGAKLRPATRAEIQADLLDPRYKSVAEHAAQGRHDWEPPDDWPDWQKYDTPNPPWVLRCETCGAESFGLVVSKNNFGKAATPALRPHED